MCLNRKQNSLLSTLLKDDEEDLTQKSMNVTSSQMQIQKETFKKQLSPKKFDPDKHCGVLLVDQNKPCTRSLSCKKHSINLRRQVIGRSKPFSELFKTHRDEKSIQSIQSIPQSKPIIYSPSPTSTIEAQNPIETLEQQKQPQQQPIHPRPYALCSFGARKIGNTFVFDRKQDQIRSLFKKAVNDFNSQSNINIQQNDDLSQPKVKQKHRDPSPTIIQPTTSSIFTPSPSSSSSSTSSFTSTLNKIRLTVGSKKRPLSTDAQQNSKFLKQQSATATSARKKSKKNF